MLANFNLPTLDNPDELRQLLCNFFKGSQLQKETLRTYVFEQLTHAQQEIERLIILGDRSTFWQQVHDLAYLSKSDPAIAAINQIQILPASIANHIKESVSSPQAFELYIQMKAAEIASGDLLKDYFLAMKIRNDQLLAYLYVFSQALTHLDHCTTFSPSDTLKHPSYQFFGERGIEDRVYEVAQILYEARVKLKLL